MKSYEIENILVSPELWLTIAFTAGVLDLAGYPLFLYL